MNATVTHTHFTLNFARKTIVGTQNSFDKASKGFGPLYEELAALMEKHPTYEIEVKKPEKPSKPKRTYKGMDIDFIRDYLTAIDDYVTLNLINDVVDYAVKMGLSKYPLAKRVLFETYKNFDYDDAKRKVELYHHQQMLEKAVV